MFILFKNLAICWYMQSWLSAIFFKICFYQVRESKYVFDRIVSPKLLTWNNAEKWSADLSFCRVAGSCAHFCWCFKRAKQLKHLLPCGLTSRRTRVSQNPRRILFCSSKRKYPNGSCSKSRSIWARITSFCLLLLMGRCWTARVFLERMSSLFS